MTTTRRKEEFFLNVWPPSVIDKLSSSITKDRYFLLFPLVVWSINVGDSRKVYGDVGTNEFRVWTKHMYWGNPIYFHGHIEATNSGTRVYGNFKWHPLTKIAFLFHIFILALGFLVTVLSIIKGLRTNFVFMGLIFGVPLLMCCVIVIVSQMRERRLKEFLKEMTCSLKTGPF